MMVHSLNCSTLPLGFLGKLLSHLVTQKNTTCEKGSCLHLLEHLHESYGEFLCRVKTSFGAVFEPGTAGGRERASVLEKKQLSLQCIEMNHHWQTKKLLCGPLVVWHIPADTYMTSFLLQYGRRPYSSTPAMRLGSTALIVLTHKHRIEPKHQQQQQKKDSSVNKTMDLRQFHLQC